MGGGISSLSTFTHSAFARAIGFAMILAISVLATLPEVSHAQACPDDTWTGPLTYTATVSTPSGPCTFTITYCYKELIPGIEYEDIVTSVTPQPGCVPCTNETPDWLIERARDVVAQVVEAAQLKSIIARIPPCTSGQVTTFETFVSDCWEDEPYVWTDGQTYNAYFPCGMTFCNLSCEWCLDSNGDLVNDGCTGTDNYTGGCQPLPPEDIWQPWTCYAVSICGGVN